MRRAQRTVDGVEGTEAAQLRAELLAWQASIRRRQGNYSEAAELATVAVAEAEAAGQARALALSLNILDWVAMESGKASAARHGDRVVEIYHELGDRQFEGNALSNLGAFAYFEGAWVRARAAYAQAVETLVDGGCLSAAAFAEANLGELLVNQGRYAEAEARLSDAFRTLRAANDVEGAGFAAQQLARIAAADDRPNAADRYFDQAFVLWETIGDARGMIELNLRRAEAMLIRGDVETATELLTSIGSVPAWAEGLGWAFDRLDAARLVADGDVEGARHRVAESVVLSEGGGPFERFQILDAYAGLCGPSADPSLLDELVEAESALGIVAGRRLRFEVTGTGDQRQA